MTTTSDDDGPDFRLSLTMRDSETTGTVALRQIALGLKPLVLIEPEVVEEDGQDVVILTVDATDMGEPLDLAEVLEVVVAGLRQAAEVAPDDDDD